MAANDYDKEFQDYLLSVFNPDEVVPPFRVKEFERCRECWRAAIKFMEEKFTAGHTLAGVAPTTTQGTKSAPEIVESGAVCTYCVHQDGTALKCSLCHEYSKFEGRRLSPVA
jgi:hypothetical protein